MLWTDLTPGELDLLLSSVRDLRPRVYLEVGVWWGGSFRRVLETRKSLGLSTECIGIDVWDELQDAVPTTHVSAWPNRRRVTRALARRGLEPFTFLVGTCADLKRLLERPVDLAFHDANHTYQAVHDDLEHLWHAMSPGATLLVHNTSEHMKPDFWYVAKDGGPHLAIAEHVAAGRWELLRYRERMAVLRKPVASS
jgi:cephalosporin hydroxylase